MSLMTISAAPVAITISVREIERRIAGQTLTAIYVDIGLGVHYFNLLREKPATGAIERARLQY